MSETTCGGACCAAFYLPWTIRELRRRAGEIEDGHFISDMVIPLTPKEANERSARFGGKVRARWHYRGHHFTCRHWDEETRLCAAYDERPRMCADYPYGDECNLAPGCSFRISPEQLVARRNALARLKEERTP